MERDISGEDAMHMNVFRRRSGERRRHLFCIPFIELP